MKCIVHEIGANDFTVTEIKPIGSTRRFNLETLAYVDYVWTVFFYTKASNLLVIQLYTSSNIHCLLTGKCNLSLVYLLH